MSIVTIIAATALCLAASSLLMFAILLIALSEINRIKEEETNDKTP